MGEAQTVAPVQQAEFDGAGARSDEGSASGSGVRIPVVPGFARRKGQGADGAAGGARSPKQEGKALRDRVPRSSHDSLVLGSGAARRGRGRRGVQPRAGCPS